MSDAPERIWIPSDPYADPWFSIYINRPDDVEYVRADEIAKLEAENEDYKITFKQKLLDNGKLRAKRDRLREEIGRAMSFLRAGGYADDAYDILRAALEEGGDDE